MAAGRSRSQLLALLYFCAVRRSGVAIVRHGPKLRIKTVIGVRSDEFASGRCAGHGGASCTCAHRGAWGEPQLSPEFV